MSNKKSCALEERHNSFFFIVPFRPAFGEAKETQKEIILMNAKVSACL